MNAGAEPPLAEQRQAILDQLRAQRRIIAEQLAPVSVQGYPRSVTMRLMTNPVLLAGLATLIAGARFGRSARAIPVIVLALRAVAALHERKRTSAAITHINVHEKSPRHAAGS